MFQLSTTLNINLHLKGVLNDCGFTLQPIELHIFNLPNIVAITG